MRLELNQTYNSAQNDQNDQTGQTGQTGQIGLTTPLAQGHKTTLDDSAAIYAKRDTRDAKAKFKDLKGKEKWNFFRDYMLGKILIIAVCAGLVIYLLYSVLAPKPETVYSVAVLDNPFAGTSKALLEETLTPLLITDPDKQELFFDYDYYVTDDSYNSRTKFMTLLAAGQIDCIILPSYEVKNYSESGMFTDLRTVLPEELIPDESEYITLYDEDLGKTIIAGIDITKQIAAMNNYDLSEKYYIICVSNSKHQDSFATVVSALRDLLLSSAPE